MFFCSSHPRGFAWPSTVPHAPRLAGITTKRRHRLPALSDAEQYFLLVPGNEHTAGIDSAPCQKVSATPAAMKTPVRAASFLQKRRLLPGDAPRQSESRGNCTARVETSSPTQVATSMAIGRCLMTAERSSARTAQDQHFKETLGLSLSYRSSKLQIVTNYGSFSRGFHVCNVCM